MMRALFLSLLMLLAAGTPVADHTLNLESLVGNWQGAGEVVLPGVEITLELTGEARIGYDTAGDFYRTAVRAEKFLFVYADSGHLFRDGHGNGVVWELWNSFGQHLRFSGVIDSRSLRGSQRFGRRTYDLELKQETVDSLSVVITEADTSAGDRVVGQFGLWRARP